MELRILGTKRRQRGIGNQALATHFAPTQVGWVPGGTPLVGGAASGAMRLT